MKKFFLITVLFLSVASLAQAQRGSGQRPSKEGGGRPNFDPEQMIERRVQGLDKAVTLTDAQKEQAKAIFKKYGEKQRESFQAMRESGEQPDREAMRAKMQEMRKAQDKEIKAILTKEQVTKYNEFLEQMKQRRQNGQGGPGQGGGGQGGQQ